MCNVKQSPGKFEGETCITVWAYDVVLNGLGNPIGEADDDNTEEIQGPFTLQEIGEYRDDGEILCD